MRAHFVVLALAAVSCADAPPDDVVPDPVAAPSSDDACATNSLPLRLSREDGVADIQSVPVVVDGQEAWLAVDTGAPLTFLFSDPAGPQYLENAGTVQLGCETWTVPGYREDAIGVEMLDGKPILGVLGIDFFADVVAEIDYPGAKMTRYLEGAPPADAFTTVVPLHGLDHDRPLVDVEIDGAALTLMFDTGAHDTIWLGVEGAADDDVGGVQTADGEVWEIFIGDGVLAMGGEAPRTVPVLRALDIGYIKPELDELGAQGLFGLTSLGWRRVATDFAVGELRMGPIVE